ncbi:restriction endonuclease subunit S [Vibrio diabolicus]|uniref:restriction endonuclease subunit S n=1 Tax=Vibrio diabolicus TaxID=50719 RepID=UPI0037533212
MSFELPFKLPTGWQVATVDELVKQKIIAKPLDGNHGGIHPKASDYIESGVPFVMASDLAGGRVDLIDCKFISEEQASGLRKGIAKAGDVLLSHKATIGRTAIVQDSKHDFIMLTPQVTYYRVINSSALSNIYLKAYFDSRFFQSILGLWAGAGSTRAYLGITGQLKLPIILPPIEIQNEISGQVHALNKKVNLNNEINQTLEEMAQTIFKSWFVDFDPVKAKMNGDQPEGMDAATASLFPEKLVESEMGLIPEGWDIASIKDFGSVVCGKTPSKKNAEFYGGDVPFIKIPDTHGKVFITETTDTLTQAGDESQPKKRIPENSICVSCIATVGQVFITTKPSHTNQQINSVVPHDSNSLYYLLFKFKGLSKHFHDLASGGSATLNMNTRTFSNVELVRPTADVMEAFHQTIGGLMQKMLTNQLENATLAQLRDTLLPKLLSGEIELGQAQELAEVE